MSEHYTGTKTNPTNNFANNTVTSFLLAPLVEEAPHGYAGIVVAVVLVIITVVGLGAFLLRKRIPTPVLGECTFDNTLYFNNPIRPTAAVDTKGLVDNIEQNETA
jgi:hypothetical protein